MRFHGRQFDRLKCRLLFWRRKFDVHQLACRCFAQPRQHAFKQHECFALVFVQRIALPVSAEADYLAEMFERDEMLAPQEIERLQQDHLFDLAIELRSELFGLLGSLGIYGAYQAFLDFLVGDAFFSRPLFDRPADPAIHESDMPIGRSSPKMPLMASFSSLVFHCSA